MHIAWWRGVSDQCRAVSGGREGHLRLRRQGRLLVLVLVLLVLVLLVLILLALLLLLIRLVVLLRVLQVLRVLRVLRVMVMGASLLGLVKIVRLYRRLVERFLLRSATDGNRLSNRQAERTYDKSLGGRATRRADHSGGGGSKCGWKGSGGVADVALIRFGLLILELGRAVLVRGSLLVLGLGLRMLPLQRRIDCGLRSNVASLPRVLGSDLLLQVRRIRSRALCLRVDCLLRHATVVHVLEGARVGVVPVLSHGKVAHALRVTDVAQHVVVYVGPTVPGALSSEQVLSCLGLDLGFQLCSVALLGLLLV